MHVKLKNTVSSIQQMDDFDLPDFAVLIGRNGIGKTQLLKAMAGGSAVISGVSRPSIELYNINSFQPQESGQGGWAHSSFFLLTIGRYFSRVSGWSLAQVAKDIFEETVDKLGIIDDKSGRHEFEKSVRMEIEKIPDFDVLPELDEYSPVGSYLNSIRVNFIYKFERGKQKNRSSQDNRRGSFNQDQAALICHAMKLSGKLPHELCHDDILRASHYEGDTIGNQLSQIFVRYKAEQHAWAHTESEACGKSVQSLMKEYRQRHRPPWEILRARIDRMREASDDPELFNFEFSDPEEDTLSYADHNQYLFEAQFTNRTSGDSYSVRDLSSGEKILLCLCLLAFNRDMGRHQPGLLLFDELDALLHPSMISALIAGLKDQFVDNGTRVIMATHSVTTVSLLEEGEIFRLTRLGSKIKVLPVARAKAVAELSEGIATIETGLRIAASGSALPITILTEGNNALHLKKWARLFFPRELELFEKLPNRTGKNELSSYGRLLARMEATTHFLIVWDCDAEKEAEKLREELLESENVTAFSFKQKQNSIASKGIENNYDEHILKQFTTTSTRSKTGEKHVTMSSRDKSDFAKYVTENATKDYFRNFDDLKSVVRGILGGRRASEVPSSGRTVGT